MKDIDTHRLRRIKLFEKSIAELNAEISKLTLYLEDPTNEDQHEYYRTSIQ